MEINITIKLDEDVVNILKEKESEGKSTKDYPVSMYARVFDSKSALWCKDSEHNLMFLYHVKDHLNNVLKKRGYVFLNEAYEALGLPKTTAGQIVGWRYMEENPNGDNFIDFGVYEDYNSEFVNGYKTTCILDFNVDGEILSAL